MNYFVKKISTHPALIFLTSFAIVILIGAILLNTPLASANHSRVGFLNALFTSTSSVCVTGLTIGETTLKFSIFGQIIILILIQIGGLAIMILSYFSLFLLRKKLSFEDKMILSFMLDETDMKQISKTIYHIIIATFIIEFLGAIILFTQFSSIFGYTFKSVFFSIFHSISAFCNAGFSLFTNNFVMFKSNIIINFTISFLIIFGGLSFVVITNLYQYLKTKLIKKLTKKNIEKNSLNNNTKVVLIMTVVLIFVGMFLFYALEHRNSLTKHNLGTGYLSSFFQSVTLRTAGFNTIDISNLKLPTYIIMTLFMFIGGASGSTAGGIKINTVSVIYSYLKTMIKGKSETLLFQKKILKDTVNKAFLIVFLMLSLVFLGVFLLSIIESFPFINILFETVSAIGTVGLSTGITPHLKVLSKLIIIMLMFIGRIGPLTVVTALKSKGKTYEVRYPQGNINIG